MFNLSDRLKAAVNQIEATGSSLQQRATSQNQQSSNPQQSGSSSRAHSPNVRTSSATASPTLDKNASSLNNAPSPSRNGTGSTGGGAAYASTTSALAEGALSGLRKSFNFGRQSLEGSRPGPSSPKATVPTSIPTQELKDIPTSPRGSSRPASPARYPTSSLSAFQLGSEPSTSVNTPRAKSPALTVTLPPDPDDPASFPLPLSPTLSHSPLADTLSPSGNKFGDPLGASPLLTSTDKNITVPELGIEEATPEEKEETVKPDLNGINGSLEKSAGANEKTEAVVKAQTDGIALETVDEDGLRGATTLEEAQERYTALLQEYSWILTQKQNADKVLKELTPLEGGIADSEALEGWVRMMKGKVDMITEEMKRLQGKITLQESRIEELRDTHRLEGSSQSELIAKLRGQLSTAETNVAQKTAELANLAKIKDDLSKAQTAAKEEEEKRTKAISLLKTVRTKLVKVEKEKEEIERDRAEERAERSSAKDEVERVKAEKEREVNLLRKGFERELAGAKERFEKELQSRKAAWELEMITTKAAHAKELSGKSTKVNGLEAIVKELNITNNAQFEDLQARQAEVESNRSELESLRNRTKELEFQLREALERAAVVEESRPNRSSRINLRAASPSPSRTSSPVEVQRLLADAEARAEAKIADLRNKVHSLEKERNEAEEEWAVKLGERVREVEKLRRVITEKESEYAESLRSRKEKEKIIEEAIEAKKGVEKEMKALQADLEEARANVAIATEAERAARDELSGLQVQVSTLSGQLEDAKNHATNLRNNNKTLREELRKVQSSVQLLERSRNPGVGYWAASQPGKPGVMSPEPETPTKERKSLESIRTAQSATTAPRAGTPGPADNKDEEEVNLEYLRNVILQFLEHKEMRPNLVRVLSVILRFTPQELRRLNAKISS